MHAGSIPARGTAAHWVPFLWKGMMMTQSKIRNGHEARRTDKAETLRRRNERNIKRNGGRRLSGLI